MNDTNENPTVWLSPLVSNEAFEIQFRDDHVHIRLGPEIERQKGSRGEFWQKLRQICDEHNTRRVLVEGSVPSGERQIADVVEAGKRTATVPDLWLAFHFDNFIPNESSELYEVIAASHGVRVKHFTSSEHALRWLRNNAPG